MNGVQIHAKSIKQLPLEPIRITEAIDSQETLLRNVLDYEKWPDTPFFYKVRMCQDLILQLVYGLGPGTVIGDVTRDKPFYVPENKEIIIHRYNVFFTVLKSALESMRSTNTMHYSELSLDDAIRTLLKTSDANEHNWNVQETGELNPTRPTHKSTSQNTEKNSSVQNRTWIQLTWPTRDQNIITSITKKAQWKKTTNTTGSDSDEDADGALPISASIVDYVLGRTRPPAAAAPPPAAAGTLSAPSSAPSSRSSSPSSADVSKHDSLYDWFFEKSVSERDKDFENQIMEECGISATDKTESDVILTKFNADIQTVLGTVKATLKRYDDILKRWNDNPKPKLNAGKLKKIERQFVEALKLETSLQDSKTFLSSGTYDGKTNNDRELTTRIDATKDTISQMSLALSIVETLMGD